MAESRERVGRRGLPGQAFVGGFFGCFGVAAALLLVLFGLATCAVFQPRPDLPAASVSGEPPPDAAHLREWARAGEVERFAGHCRLALLRLGHSNAGTAPIYPAEHAAVTITEARSWPIIACAGVSRGRPVTARVAVSCADSDDARCSVIERASLEGAPLRLPKRR